MPKDDVRHFPPTGASRQGWAMLGGGVMTDWALVLGWGTPIGIGVFLVCIAATVFLFSRVSRSSSEPPGKKE